MTDVPHEMVPAIQNLLRGIVARLDKARAVSGGVAKFRIDVQRAGGPTRSFDNGAAITFTVTEL